jgi:hypothetical protein
MAGALVQARSTEGNGSAPTLAFLSNATAANLIVARRRCVLQHRDLRRPHRRHVHPHRHRLGQRQRPPKGFYAKNIVGGASTMTFNFGGTTDFGISIEEWSGLDTVAPQPPPPRPRPHLRPAHRPVRLRRLRPCPSSPARLGTPVLVDHDGHAARHVHDRRRPDEDGAAGHHPGRLLLQPERGRQVAPRQGVRPARHDRRPTFTWSVRLLTSTTWSAAGVAWSTAALTAGTGVTLAPWYPRLRADRPRPGGRLDRADAGGHGRGARAAGPRVAVRRVDPGQPTRPSPPPWTTASRSTCRSRRPAARRAAATSSSSKC